jgi:hypothetical protein
MHRFIILATPRSGSRLVSSMLASHPDVTCYDEIFTPHGSNRLAIGPVPVGGVIADPMTVSYDHVTNLGHRYYDWFFEQYHDVSYVGFTLHLLNNRQHTRWALADKCATKILVRRSNLLAQFVSWQNARIQNKWVLGRDEVRPAQDKLRVEPGEFEWYVDQQLKGWSKVRSYCERHRIEYHTVIYETISETFLRPLLLKLGLEPLSLKAGFRKQARGPVSDRIQNWAFLKRWLKPAYQHYLNMADAPEII